MSAAGPEAQDSLFDSSVKHPSDIPDTFKRAASRLEFPPSYIVVGAYRLFTDKLLFGPAWDKCRHGTRRGALVGLVWATLTFNLQKEFFEVFLRNSPRVTGLSSETVFGYKIPFSLTTYAAVLLVGEQVTYILRFFLSHNIRIARDRAWQQTVASRGKGPDFWSPYVEEWAAPPVVDVDNNFGAKFERTLGNLISLFVVKRILLLPFNLYPFIGTAVSAYFKALGTARILHTPYFAAKKMSDQQVAVFMEERKWDYRAFGFAAALLESIPIIGLVFTISNRVGAAMWAHDLEKRQHLVRENKLEMKP